MEQCSASTWGGVYRQRTSRRIATVYRNYLNPYLYFHRRCAQAEVRTDEKGRTRRRYPQGSYQTPWEKLQRVPGVRKYLREDLSLEVLKRMAEAMSDTEAAQRMQKMKHKLLQKIHATA